MSQDQIYGLIQGYLITSVAVYGLALVGVVVYALFKRDR